MMTREDKMMQAQIILENALQKRRVYWQMWKESGYKHRWAQKQWLAAGEDLERARRLMGEVSDDR